MQPIQCDLQPQIQETHRTTHTGTTTRCRTQRRIRLTSKRSKPQPPHTRGTFHRRLQPLYMEKYKVACSGFLPKTKPMQHSCTHNNAFCSMTWLPGYPACIYAHGNTRWQQSYSHSNAICNHRVKKRIELRTQEQTTRCRTQRRNRLTSKPQPPHTRGTFHRRLQPLYTEKYKVSCSGFLPKTKPMQRSCSHYNAFCSMTWLPGYPACIYVHGNTRWQQSCSHSNAICNHRFNKRIELRTQEQPLIAEHRGGSDWPRNDPNPNRRTHEVPFIAGCSHFTRKNTRFRAPASSPKQSPCNIHAAITIRLAAWRGYPATPHASTHMATPDDNNHAAIPMRSATTESRNA